MLRRVVLGTILILILIGMLSSAFNIRLIESEPGMIIVPDDYPTIQAAINAASTGDTIFVKAGTYYEQILTQNHAPGLKIIGQNRDTTVIDAGGSPYYTIELNTDNNTISSFTLRNPGYPYGGIRFYHASNNLLNDTLIVGVHYGIEMTRANNNTIQYCNVSENVWTGIVIDFDSSNNTIKENTISYNGLAGIGISAHSSYPPGPINNTVYHNNFVANTKQVSIYYAGLDFTNIWDNGYPSGGNYWSDYAGVDLYSGPYQNEAGSDGIGDTPYVIDEKNTDHYPMLMPLTTHDVAITNTVPDKTLAMRGQQVTITVTAQNQGSYAETFNVTAYANTTIVGKKEIVLTIGNSLILTFTWDTTGFAVGNYKMSANATRLAGEIDAADNNYIDGTVQVIPLRDIAVTKAWFSNQEPLPGETVSIYVEVENQGEVIETFGVTAILTCYFIRIPGVSVISLGTQTVTLPIGAFNILTFTWSPIAGQEGVYILGANATQLPNEIDLADNTCLDGYVGFYPLNVIGKGEGRDKCMLFTGPP